MPASTLDPVNAAIRSSLSKTASETNLDVQLAGATKKALLVDIEFEAAGSYQTSVLDKLKTKYIVLKSTDSPQIRNTEKMGADEALVLAKHELYPLEAVQLGWSNTEWVVGAGMVNMGNTCYLNSTLQALFHVPALVNWLLSDKQHMSQCEDSGGLCIICAMRKTLQDSQQRNTNSIRPFLIYNKLRVVCRNLIPGRQEDAHEFLRYLVEAMEKAYLRRFKNHSEFDSRTKETTPLNQILGGYLRSAVRCLECGHVSTTFQHFQDLLLDIRKAQTLEEALDGYFSREKLDDESYHCESCQKKVPATKQFSLERAPMVLCIQLKRFSVSNNKITKHVQFRSRLELTKFARHRPPVPLLYRFVALVTHMGPTVGCGHYTAVAQAPCGNYYQFDDSMVRPISHQAVFSTNAYIMLYELECPPFTSKSQNANSVVSTSISSSPSKTKTSASSSSNACAVSNNDNGGYYVNSNNGGGSVVLTVHNVKNLHAQQETGSTSTVANKSTSKTSGAKVQLNGPARTIYGSSGSGSSSNVDMIMTITMTTATVTTTTTMTTGTATTTVSSSDQNGTDRSKKANGNAIGRSHAHFLLLSSSTTEENDSKEKREQREEELPIAARQNGDAAALPPSPSTTAACETKQHKSKSSKASSHRSSAIQSTSNDVGNSPTRSCSSSSVSSLSSNVDRGGSSSPKPVDSPKTAATAATPSTSAIATTSTTQSFTKLVPYDVDDDDDNDDDEEDDDDEENHEADDDNELEAECSSSGGSSCAFGETEASLPIRTTGAAITTTTTTISSASTTTATTTITTATAISVAENSLAGSPRVLTKATTADWQVTSSVDQSPQTPSSEGRSWNKKCKPTYQKEGGVLSSSASTVSELLKMSHVGYSAPISSWNGTRAGLDKEVNEERREERKRMLCDNADRGRVKHIKTNSSSSNSYVSNPGYNRLQEFHNAKNSWNQNNNDNVAGGGASCSSSSYSGRQFYDTSGGKHRNRRNNFHHKNNNYHKNNYAFRQ